jgi:maltose O-acetyltransferase
MDARFQNDGRSQRERMLAGDQYVADDPNLIQEGIRAARLTREYNATAPDDVVRL